MIWSAADTVGAQQKWSYSLKVGDTSTLVEVTGAAPVIETTNATLSGNIESAQNRSRH